ncbi:DUF4956 domain-containing protein [Aeromicrobium ginsengisoli]|uniref:DUF4956 domain-containing protein n=1 Tax=Aeromicrobium ginsengisoli TaxID=363867 RepID=A0A5M4FI82_9ACTN|nr:DUF4956 domain-containing protein [Aeromicrobium ginsengisoli]KAA1399894.1 DUF4956 domain-containing protein [Aeromicrobium ginsengisoli]
MGTVLTSDAVGLLVRLGIDVLALFVLVGWLYRRRPSAPAMPLVFAVLNIGLFAALSAISAGSFKAGVGFGLFGLLSLVRLRSTAFTLKDVAYTFIALVLGLVNGLQERQLWLVVVLNVLLVLVVAISDDSRTEPATRVMRLTLDHLVLDPDEARLELTGRLAVPIVAVIIDDVDFVRETTRVSVRYEVADQVWQTPDGADASTAPDPGQVDA